MELFEEIRREYEFGCGSIRGVSDKLGVHRRLVRQALACALPPERKVSNRACPVLEAVKPFVDAILLADKQAPRKQRHTAHRIWARLREEMPEHPVAESTVRAYIRKRKQALGLACGDVHVPQDYPTGDEAQVDWYEAFADIDAQRTKVQVFAMRSMYSGAAFHRAYRHATQQAFLEAHELAFHYFGGVFRTLRYDNLTSAVKKILRGYTRQENERFIAFRSHWQFSSEFCTPGEPQEKGGIEGEVGTFRRNRLVPVPQAPNMGALNELLLADCMRDHERIIGERTERAGQLMHAERVSLLPIPGEGFDIAHALACRVDGKGCVRVGCNFYSTPLRSGTSAHVRVLPADVEVWYEGRCVASHERDYRRGQQIYNLEHYLDTLKRKPGALKRARPLSQWRAAGRWPECLDRLWEQLNRRHGSQTGTRYVVELLLLAREHGWSRLVDAAEKALALGCVDHTAVRCLMLWPTSEDQVCALGAEDLCGLERYDRPAPEMSAYDMLLGGVQ